MGKRHPDAETTTRLRRQFLSWYKHNRRDLPWRESADSYAIWVSEIMLQQTRVAAVVERYKAFLSRFPTLLSLALAREDEVLALWSGLGYYRRARMLLKAAQLVVDRLKGTLPATAEELRKLPGIGSYTAAAIASIAHGERVAVVDGNVERVLCRLAGWSEGDRQGSRTAQRRKVEALAQRLVDPAQPGNFNQAMMELGATVCLPRGPKCAICPVAKDCLTRGEHKTLARPRMESREVAYALSVRTGHDASALSREVLLKERPATVTVMPGMWELPELRDAHVPEGELRMTVRHAIMQVNYFVRIRTVFEDDAEKLLEPEAVRRWVPLGEAVRMPLTGLARKVLMRARLLPMAQAIAVSQ